MKCIRVWGRQPHACYRVPPTAENIESYPLPPYSTVIGWIHRMLGVPLGTTVPDLRISVQGRYETLLRNYTRYHKYEEDPDKGGKAYPLVVTELFNVHLCLHIYHPSGEVLHRMLHALRHPPEFPALGRHEDLIMIASVDEVSFEPVSEMEPISKILAPDSPLRDFSVYVPITAVSDETDWGRNGIRYVLDEYYERVGDFRVFQSVDVVYLSYRALGEADDEDLHYHVDADGIPIWWQRPLP